MAAHLHLHLSRNNLDDVKLIAVCECGRVVSLQDNYCGGCGESTLNSKLNRDLFKVDEFLNELLRFRESEKDNNFYI